MANQDLLTTFADGALTISWEHGRLRAESGGSIVMYDGELYITICSPPGQSGESQRTATGTEFLVRVFPPGVVAANESGTALTVRNLRWLPGTRWAISLHARGGQLLESSEFTVPSVSAPAAEQDSGIITGSKESGMSLADLMISLKKASGDELTISAPLERTSPLPALRKKLGAWLEDTDRFLMRGKPIVKEEESLQTIGDVVSTDTPATGFKINIELGQVGATQAGSSVGTLPASRGSLEPPPSRTEELVSRLRAGTSAVLQSYSQLSNGERLGLLKHLGCLRGLVMNSDFMGTDTQKHPAIDWAHRDVMMLSAGSLPDFRVPRETYDEHQSISYEFLGHELRKLTDYGGELDVKAKNVFTSLGLKANLVKQEHDYSTSKTTNIYSLCERIIPKVRLYFPVEGIHLSEAAIADAKEIVALAKGDAAKKSACLEKIKHFLRVWGSHVGTEYLIGGTLFVEDRRTSKNKEDEHKSLTDLSLALNLKLSFLDAQAKLHYHREAEGKEKSESENRLITIQAIGGDPASVGDPTGWIGSLGLCENWRILKVSGFVPVFSLLRKNDDMATIAEFLKTLADDANAVSGSLHLRSYGQGVKVTAMS
ncbi:MAG: hypothetical protein HYY25_16525 [Candidatus Wallbacteria bacterium]|nr:hypothetical protein [Candidatus Wallbacteria bacterium]